MAIEGKSAGIIMIAFGGFSTFAGANVMFRESPAPGSLDIDTLSLNEKITLLANALLEPFADEVFFAGLGILGAGFVQLLVSGRKPYTW